MFKTMSEIAVKIFNIENNILKMKYDIAQLNEELSIKESIMLNEISSATDDNGKPLYSNSDKRQAALNEEKLLNKLYIELSEKLKNKSFELEKTKIKFNFYKNIFDSHKYKSFEYTDDFLNIEKDLKETTTINKKIKKKLKSDEFDLDI